MDIQQMIAAADLSCAQDRAELADALEECGRLDEAAELRREDVRPLVRADGGIRRLAAACAYRQHVTGPIPRAGLSLLWQWGEKELREGIDAGTIRPGESIERLALIALCDAYPDIPGVGGALYLDEWRAAHGIELRRL